MHRALDIQEVLDNIFGQLRDTKPELAALATTCRAFKEQALDLLWEQLSSLHPLAVCLPDASSQVFPSSKKSYSFHRPLTLIEWGILQSYTRRIRYIRGSSGLDQKSLQRLLNPPSIEPLFSNLRHLSFFCAHSNLPLALFPLPSLISLEIQIDGLNLFESSEELFAETYSKPIKLRVETWDHMYIHPSLIRRWMNLKAVDCYAVNLDLITLVHMSRMPALTWLHFTISPTLLDQISPTNALLVFSRLATLSLGSGSLASVSCILSHIRLPALKSLDVYIDQLPSKSDITPFFANVQTSGVGPTIQDFQFVYDNPYESSFGEPEELRVLGLEDLRLSREFSNLRLIDIDLPFRVDLTDNDLVSLASAWPQAETLHINRHFGWNAVGGITPNGLLQLLQACRSLRVVSLAMDTRIYNVPPSSRSDRSALNQVDVLDSAIEEESVPVMSAFFAGIARGAGFTIRASQLGGLRWFSQDKAEECTRRWEVVGNLADETIRGRRYIT